MGLQNGTLLDGATVSATGGTAVTLSIDGQKVNNGIHLINAANTDYRTRQHVSAKTIQPTLKANGTYTKGKKSMTLTHPKVLASGISEGVQEFPNIRIELSDHPEMSQAEIDKLCIWGAQLLTDPDFLAFWRTGSQA